MHVVYACIYIYAHMYADAWAWARYWQLVSFSVAFDLTLNLELIGEASLAGQRPPWSLLSCLSPGLGFHVCAATHLGIGTQILKLAWQAPHPLSPLQLYTEELKKKKKLVSNPNHTNIPQMIKKCRNMEEKDIRKLDI